MSLVFAYTISFAIVLMLGSSPKWAQVIIFSVIHTIIGYFLPLVLVIRAVHNQDSESFHSIYLTYFVFLFTILEPFSNFIRHFHNYPLSFQLSTDLFILWLLLPKSQGIRHLHSILTNHILHSHNVKTIETCLTTGFVRRASDFIAMQIYPVVVQYLISHALWLHQSQLSNYTPPVDPQQSKSEQQESNSIMDHEE